MALSGDRALGGKQVAAPFLEGRARFPLLGFALARATGAPVCIGLAFPTGLQRFDFLGIGPIDDDVTDDGSGRSEDERLAALFADRLAEQLRRFPTQWFNFYDFWEG